MKRTLLFTVSHLATLAIGFALGVYLLPILIAPEGPSQQDIRSSMPSTLWTGEFRRNLKGSDALHWGEGTVSVGKDSVSLVGRLAPGPDYKLYFSTEFVETKADFLRLKPQMVRVADVKTFDNFLVPLPAGFDASKYTSVIVWCETFGQFITAAKYR